MDIKWIFSGVGVPVIVALALFLKRVLKKEHPPTPIQNLDPVAIIHEINAAPFLHRKDTAQRYCGARIEWSGRLYSLYEGQKGRVRLQLSVPKDVNMLNGVSVDFEIRSKDYPGLNLLHDDSIVKFQGVIKEIYSRAISLKDVKLVEWLPTNS